jgi:hypothetical protein
MNNNKMSRVHIVMIDNLQLLYQQWSHHDEFILVMRTLSFMDVKTLLQTQLLNKT